MRCNICKEEFNTINELPKHVFEAHFLLWEEYFRRNLLGTSSVEDIELPYISGITFKEERKQSKRKTSFIIDGKSLSNLSTYELQTEVFNRLTKYSNDGYDFKDDYDAIITRDELIRLNETTIFSEAPGREWTQTYILPLVSKIFRDYVKRNGLFYPKNEESLYDITKNVRSSMDIGNDRIAGMHSSKGTNFLKSRFKSYWNTKNGVYEKLWNDVAFNGVLMYRLGLNNSKLYEYKLDNKQVVNCKETFDINIKNIRAGFVVGRHVPSFFKPEVAAQIYYEFLKDTENPVVWDPSGGFGARMLGFYSAFPKGKYFACEPATMTHEDLCSLGTELMRASNQEEPFVATVKKCGSENFELPDNSVDFAFTSPPYFDRECYFDEPGQCWKDYPAMSNWNSGYLIPTMKNAFNMLKHGRYLGWNVFQKLEDICVKAALSVGFIREENKDILLKINKDHFSRKYGNTDNGYERVLIFRKP